MRKLIGNSSYGSYSLWLSLPMILFLAGVGIFVECVLIYLCFKDNKEVKEIIIVTVLSNVVTFVFGLIITQLV